MKPRSNYDRVCADCEHSEKPNRRGPVWICKRVRNLVTGDRPTAPVACVTMRDRKGQCGPEGRLFEERKINAKKLEPAE